MRNLEECKAEVFRRSEARIRARKRRRIAILTACVPVVLCIALVWTAGLPGTENETASGSAAECATEPVKWTMGADVSGNPLAPQIYGSLFGKTETDFPGVEIQVMDFDPENGGMLTVVWENQTEFEVTYGESYTIQRREGDRWVSCQRRPDLAFNAIAYLLLPGQVRTEQYRLTYTYDVSEPGLYRFESNCYVHNTPNESAECTLSAEFTVE